LTSDIFILFLCLNNRMVITHVEHLEDRIKIDYEFKNGIHIPDEGGYWDVLYEEVPKLPNEPELPKHGNHWAEEVFVEKLGRKIVYHFEEFQETVSSRMQVRHGGPYLRV